MAPVLFTFEELNSYEQVRTPHEIEKKDIAISVNSDAVKSEFTCIICLDMLRKTMTSHQCLHRFCYDCITTSLRLGNKECPTCRAKLASKRDLREDPVFDSLIGRLFPQKSQRQEEPCSSRLTENIPGLHQTALSKSPKKQNRSQSVNNVPNKSKTASIKDKRNTAEKNKTKEFPKINVKNTEESKCQSLKEIEKSEALEKAKCQTVDRNQDNNHKLNDKSINTKECESTLQKRKTSNSMRLKAGQTEIKFNKQERNETKQKDTKHINDQNEKQIEQRKDDIIVRSNNRHTEEKIVMSKSLRKSTRCTTNQRQIITSNNKEDNRTNDVKDSGKVKKNQTQVNTLSKRKSRRARQTRN